MPKKIKEKGEFERNSEVKEVENSWYNSFWRGSHPKKNPFEGSSVTKTSKLRGEGGWVIRTQLQFANNTPQLPPAPPLLPPPHKKLAVLKQQLIVRSDQIR